MKHLLYSSKEMFSSTQLVRKSKDIFDKLANNDISKAVILRDGKPNFMLLDFKKYEDLMKEFQKLDNFYKSNKNLKQNHNKEIFDSNDEIQIRAITLSDKENNNIDEEKELLDALKQLDSLNLDPDLKAQTQEKLKAQPTGEIKEFWN